MKIQQLLSHHHLVDNPFSQEDAKEDRIFKTGCVDHTFHPSWDKIVGDPESPSSAVVFGEKGSGKTALRIQMVEFFKKFNAQHPARRALILEYDDFNPFLDQFSRKEAHLGRWELRDHMDAILSLGTSTLANMILNGSPDLSPAQLAQLSHLDRRDLLMLAAVYDSQHDTTLVDRWHALRRKLRVGWYRGGPLRQPALLSGALVTALVLFLATYFHWWAGLGGFWWVLLIVIAASWVPFVKQWARAQALAHKIDRSVRTIHHSIPDLRQVLLWFHRRDIEGQPVWQLDTSDARYVLLNKLQAVLRKLGYHSILVIVDRVDEPHRVSGNAAVMHQVMRSIFELKFLQHPDLGIKLLLPGDMYPYIQSEKQEFRDRARLDKQKFIPSLVWTGQSLEDLVNDRLQACTEPGNPPPTLRTLLDERISDGELTSYLAQLKIPRHVFKFMYQLLMTHCNNHTESNPEWRISRETFTTTWAVFNRDLQRYEQGLIMG